MTHKPDSGSQTPECDPQALLPCPFCGSVDVKSRSNGWGKVYHQCQGCEASGPRRTVSLRKPWPDVEVWNTRAQSAQIATLQAEVERLREAVKSARGAFADIRELNMTDSDENGHRWANSDLIEQSVMEGLCAIARAEAAEGCQ